MYTKSRDILWSHDLVGMNVNSNGGGLASEPIWLYKTSNFLINHQRILIILAVYEPNMSVMRMAVFMDGDNSSTA